MPSLERRLEALEIALAPRCYVCHDRILRSAVIDAVGTVSESRPAVCPLCGSRPAMMRTIILEDVPA
jgi:DNA-directed RNA polymerase subunit RPC12/RpoP